MLNKIYIIIFLFICMACTNKQKITNNLQKDVVYKDSIAYYLKKSKDKNEINALNYAEKAFKIARKNQNDSLWFSALNRISILQYRKLPFSAYKKSSQLYLEKAKQASHPLYIAKGHYKMGSYYLKKAINDSAYYHFNKAKIICVNQKDSLKVVANLLNMATIQNRVSDFYGSEVTSVEALNYIIKGSKKYVLSLYNNLGNSSFELEQYDDALYWYKKSLPLLKTEKEQMVINNNLGVTKRNQKQYGKAIVYFQKGLNNPKINDFQGVKAMLLDNIGYTYFQLKDKRALTYLTKGYHIRKEQRSIRGEIVSELHLGEYYQVKGAKKQARNLFISALQKATKLKDIKNKKKALFFLSTITAKDKYIYNYIALKDSISKEERKFKDQFAKIRYRTKEKESDNLKLQNALTIKTIALKEQQYNKNLYRLINVSLLMLLVIGIFYYKQRQRIQKQLLIIEKLKAKSEEKQKISMHLHDDIASDLLIGLQQGDQLQKQLQNKHLEHILKFFERSYNKLRDVSQDLSIQKFKHISFKKKIEKLCIEFSFKNDTKINVLGLESVLWDKIPEEIKYAIYRIIKEALVNILKHASASKGVVRFEKNKKQLFIEIQDNGIGFKKLSKSGIGLLNIEKRIEEINGSFVIENLKPKGSILKITILIQ